MEPEVAGFEVEQFGKYRLHGEIASGGMARIYLATMDGPGGFLKPCVIKKVRPEFQQQRDFSQMFVTEARVAALLNHPNIVQAFDFGQIEEEYFLALEFVEGASLYDVVREARLQGLRLSLNVVVSVGIALCEALAYAHAARGPDGAPLRIVHRDISPANVLVSTSGGVKLTDFGIVKSAAASFLSKPDVVKGKLNYMSPEQLQGHPVDGRSDLYSLGIVLYELATGERPLWRPTLEKALKAAVAAEIAPPSAHVPSFPQTLEAILMRVLARDADDRYPNAKALQAELERFRSDQHWTSGTNELASLLTRLFPDGPPANAAALLQTTPSWDSTRSERPRPPHEPALPDFVEVDWAGTEDAPPEEAWEEPDPEAPPPAPDWLQRGVVLLGLIAACLGLWLFALSGE